MLDVRRRPMGRLFYGLLGIFLCWMGVATMPACAADAAPATTRVRYGLSGGWNAGFGDGLDFLAGIYHFGCEAGGSGE